jgi:hypothetical protein
VELFFGGRFWHFLLIVVAAAAPVVLIFAAAAAAHAGMILSTTVFFERVTNLFKKALAKRRNVRFRVLLREEGVLLFSGRDFA